MRVRAILEGRASGAGGAGGGAEGRSAGLGGVLLAQRGLRD